MRRAVIADDHPLFRSAISQFLQKRASVEVVGEAADGVQLIEMVEKLRPDVLLLDMSMPRKDGLAITRELSGWGRPPKIVILTGYVSLFFAVRCYRAGAYGFVSKSDPPGEILKAVEAAISGRRYVPPNLVHDVATHLLEHQGEGDPIDSLTPRELEVMRLIASGATNREIGGELGISVRTVDTHRSNLLKKLGLRNNADLTRVALAFKLVAS